MNTIRTDSPLFQRGENTQVAEPIQLDENDTLDRFFPRPVRLTMPGHVVRHFPMGFQKVPRALADDSWLRMNGMIDPNTGSDPLPLQPQAPLGSQGYAASVMQSGVYDATMIPAAYQTDEGLRSADANARLASENVRTAQENLDNALRVHAAATEALRRGTAEREQNDRDKVDRRENGGAGGSTRKNDKEVIKLRKEDQAKYDKLSAQDKRAFDESSHEEQVIILAGQK